MALYSMNRVSSIAAVDECAAVLEENELNAIMAELDECAANPVDDAMSLIEACIVIEETDHKMFNALIEKDFITIQNEAVLSEADAKEANDKADTTAKKSLGEKIKEIIATVIKAVQNAYAAALKKLDALGAVKYEEYINKISNGNFTSVKITGRKIKDVKTAKTVNTSAVTAAVNKANSALNAADNSEQIKAAKDAFVEDFNKIEDTEYNKKMDECFEKEGEYSVDMNYIKLKCIPVVKDFHTAKAELKKATAEVIKSLKDAEKLANANVAGKSDAVAEIYKAKYDIAVYAAKHAAKVYNQLIHIIVLEKNEARKAILAAVKAAGGAKKEDKSTDAPTMDDSDTVEATGESVELDSIFTEALCESCDAIMAF